MRRRAGCRDVRRLRSPSGPRPAALAVDLSVAQLVPLRRRRQTLADLFGVHLSQGTIAGLVARTAERFAGPARHVRDAVAQAPVKHMDETGIRVRGRLAWLHVACTGRDRSRGARPLAARLQQSRDHPGPLRRAVNLSEGKPLPERLRDLIVRRYDRIVAEGIAMHEARPPPPAKGHRGRRKRRRGHNLALRLRDNRDGVLRFPRPTTRPSGRCGPSMCSRRSPEASAARREPGTTRRCEPSWTRPGNRDETCWRRSAPRRTSWSRSSSRGSRTKLAEPPGRTGSRQDKT